jgi:aspartate aminotransferase
MNSSPGKQIYDLGLEENPMPPPIDLKKVLIKNNDEPNRKKKLKNLLETDNIIIAHGLKPLLYITQLAFSKAFPEGTICHIIPYCPSYKYQSDWININKIKIPCNKKWKVTYNGLDKALKDTTFPRLVFFNNANNPSGCIYNKTELGKLAKIFNKYKCIVLSDERYDKLVYEKYREEYGSISNHYSNTIIANCLSNNWSGNNKYGWLKFPKNIINDELLKLYKFSSSITSLICNNPNEKLHNVAVEALSLSKNTINYMEFQNKMFNEINSYCHEKLENMKIKCSITKSAWYKLLNFNHYKKKLNKINIVTSDELCKYLSEKLNIITVSGSVFGIEKPLIIRISFIDVKINYKSFLTTSNAYNYVNVKKCLEKLEYWLSNL